MLVPFLLLVLGYAVLTLLTARVAYGIERSRAIAQEREMHADEDPLQRFLDADQNPVAALSFVYGLAWPVVVPVYCCYRLAALVITTRPPETPYERAAREEELDSRIQELEESLGLRGHRMDENGPMS